jgi:hypothetical protein
MAITDDDLISATPGNIAYCIYDTDAGGNLFACVDTNGEIHWQMEYLFRGQRNFLFLGLYPAISIGRAKRLKMAILNILDRGIDPMQVKNNSDLILELALECVVFHDDVQCLSKILQFSKEHSEIFIPEEVLLGKDPFEVSEKPSSFTKNAASYSRYSKTFAL